MCEDQVISGPQTDSTLQVMEGYQTLKYTSCCLLGTLVKYTVVAGYGGPGLVEAGWMLDSRAAQVMQGSVG